MVALHRVRLRLRGRSPSGRLRRGVGILTALLLLGVPAVVGATPSGPEHFALGRATAQTSRVIEAGGCHQLSASSPRFHRATGEASWQARALAKSCPVGFQGPGATDEASESVTIEIALPVKTLPGSAVATTVSVEWNISGLGNISTQISGGCPSVLLNGSTGDGTQYCEIAAYAGIGLDAYLYDVTNGSTFTPTTAPTGIQVYNDTTNSTYCYDYSCSSYNDTSRSSSAAFSNPFTERIDLSGTLDHHHRYVVVTTLTAFVETLVTGYTGPGRASATLNLATGGQGALLTGVVVT
jgi:hypothetical protein